MKNANRGFLTSWVKLSALLLLFISGAVYAETCPPVLPVDSKIFGELKVRGIDLNGKIEPLKAMRPLQPTKGKVTVIRLYGTWCPYCKQDIQSLNSRFEPLVGEKKLDIVLVSFQSRKETDESIDLFLNHGVKELNVDKKNFRWAHSDIKSADVKSLKNNSDEDVFPGFLGVPYGLVFDDKGRLRFQGHFTGEESVRNKHYDMINSLASGRCS